MRDVTSGASEPQPLQVNLRVLRTDSGFNDAACTGPFLIRHAGPAFHFRIREDPVGPAPPEMLLDVTTAQAGDNVFPLEVSPNSVLSVDFYLEAQVQATGANVDEFGMECPGGDTRLTFYPDGTPGHENDGFQIFLSPAPTLTVTSRGGFAYEPVPEPGADTAAWVVALALAAARRARRDRDR
jgi:hypothetical protein